MNNINQITVPKAREKNTSNKMNKVQREKISANMERQALKDSMQQKEHQFEPTRITSIKSLLLKPWRKIPVITQTFLKEIGYVDTYRTRI
jgi:hypothetical protein